MYSKCFRKMYYFSLAFSNQYIFEKTNWKRIVINSQEALFSHCLRGDNTGWHNEERGSLSRQSLPKVGSTDASIFFNLV